jgi:hypothetical protein
VTGQRDAPTTFHPQERPGTHCTGGWVGPRAGLDRCEKSGPHRNFFYWHIKWYIVPVIVEIYRQSPWSGSVDYSRDLIWFSIRPFFPLRSMFHYRSSGVLSPVRSPDRPARSQSLYQLSYPSHTIDKTIITKCIIALFIRIEWNAQTFIYVLLSQRLLPNLSPIKSDKSSCSLSILMM